MNSRLRPELGRLIEEDVQRGPYQSLDEFIERAVSLLHEQETWLASHRTEIAAKIEEGYAASQRGELLDQHAVRQRVARIVSSCIASLTFSSIASYFIPCKL